MCGNGRLKRGGTSSVVAPPISALRNRQSRSGQATLRGGVQAVPHENHSDVVIRFKRFHAAAKPDYFFHSSHMQMPTGLVTDDMLNTLHRPLITLSIKGKNLHDNKQTHPQSQEARP
jgi:hypothetical protein